MKGFKLNNPCSENWDNMTPEGKNKFCVSCQKTVHDFSKSSPEEITRFFKRPREEKVCGFVMKDQIVEVNQKLNQRSSNSVSKLIKPGIVASSIMLASCGVTKSTTYEPKLESGYKIVNPNINSNLSDTILVKGQIKELNGESIPWANVVVESTKIGTVSDLDGRFQLIIPKSHVNSDTLTVIASFIGYQIQTIPLVEVKNAEIEVFIEEMNHFLGEIEIDLPVHKRIWYKIKYWFRS